MVAFGRLLFERGLTSGTGGNLSIRVKNRLLITPSGLSLGFLENGDLIAINDKGEKLEGMRAPSSEKLMHIFVYKNRADIQACCHAHPPYATAFSLTDQELRCDIHPEAVLTLGDIAQVEYASPGTDDVPRALESCIKHYDVYILKNHGVLTLGRDMKEAYYRMETVEHLAKIMYIAKRAGKIDFLEKNEVARLRKIRRDYNGEGSR